MMGFEDRAYSQEESWNSTPTVETNVTKWLVIVTVAVFLMQAVSVTRESPNSFLYELISLKAGAVLQGQVWRLLTFAICHHPVDIISLVFSLLIIWRIGGELERMYGSREILMYYLAMVLFVGLTFTAWGLVVQLPMPMSGSFTIALGLLTLFATHFPRMEVYILPLISIQLRWLVALYALFGLYPALQVLQAGGGLIGLAYASTVLSILFALAYRRFDWHLSAIGNYLSLAAWRRAWRTRATRHRLRVYEPVPDQGNLDAKVDLILAKIHEQGSESLTEAERALLNRASERYKNRP